jgi:DNA (cytosine-5)-methyltransferase 1
MNKPLTMGSLFPGIDGFELVGALYGIEPVWASEIVPLPIRVTTKRFPNMLHLGGIVWVSGQRQSAPHAQH